MCAVPCLGVYLVPIALIWWGVCATLMLARAHGAGGFRSTLAIFTPIVVLLGGTAATIIFFVSWATTMVATAASFSASQTPIQDQRAIAVLSALRNHGLTNNAYPPHAGQLLFSGTVGIGELSLSTDPLIADNILIGNTTLGSFELATSEARQKMASAAAAALPPSVIAHRLGDYVFTYHGIDPNTADPGLWLFIAELPSTGAPIQATPNATVAPSTNNSAPPEKTGRLSASSSGAVTFAGSSPVPSFIVGLSSGRTQAIPKVIFPQSLAGQNSLRQALSLPPLPDPTTVTVSSPALGAK
jgi:hypothetical protein